MAELLGASFLAFALSLDEPTIEARLGGELARLDEPYEQALSDLVRHASELVKVADAYPDGGLLERVRRLGWVDMDRENSHANLFRLATGGELPSIPPGLDAAERALLRAAIDYYPLTLLPGPADQPFPAKPLIAQARVRAVGAAMTAIDDPLLRLFEPDVTYYTSTGFGYGPMWPFRVAECALAVADQLNRAQGDTSPEAFLDKVLSNFRIMRTLAVDEVAEVPTLIGISNVETRDDLTIRAPRNGTFRAATQRDPQVSMADRATMVLETSVTVRLAVGATPPPWNSGFFDGTRTLVKEEQLISLAGLLATSRSAQRTMPVVVWTRVFDPFQPYIGTFRSARPVSMTSFPAAELHGLEQWLLRLDAHYHPSIDVAVRRTVKAFAERPEADDALIDLVIALENLFATRGPKLKQRIASALVQLLAHSPREQRDIKDRAEAVYEARSDLVHGDELAESEIHPRDHAEKLVLKAFEVFFTSQTELIADRRGRSRLGRSN